MSSVRSMHSRSSVSKSGNSILAFGDERDRRMFAFEGDALYLVSSGLRVPREILLVLIVSCTCLALTSCTLSLRIGLVRWITVGGGGGGQKLQLF